MFRTAAALAVPAALALPVVLAGPVAGDEGCPQIVQGITEAWLAAAEIGVPPLRDMEEAECVQAGLVTAVGGAPIGWKVGLTSTETQERLGVDRPLAGRLLQGMILEDGARIGRDYAARPLVEADLILRVGDAAIMQATTQEEALAHIDAFVPFIELADLMYREDETLSAEALVAINVGARSGVVGEPVAMAVNDDWLNALAGMTVRLEYTDENGEPIEVIGDTPGSAVLGHPLEAVLWLVDHLSARGESLEAGDLISVGSFGPPATIPDAGGIRVTYLRLPGGEEPTALVRFRDGRD